FGSGLGSSLLDLPAHIFGNLSVAITPGLLFGHGGLPVGFGLASLLRLACRVGAALFLGQARGLGPALLFGDSGRLALFGDGFFEACDQLAQALVVLLEAGGLSTLRPQFALDALKHLLALGLLCFKLVFFFRGLLGQLCQLAAALFGAGLEPRKLVERQIDGNDRIGLSLSDVAQIAQVTPDGLRVVA